MVFFRDKPSGTTPTILTKHGALYNVFTYINYSSSYATKGSKTFSCGHIGPLRTVAPTVIVLIRCPGVFGLIGWAGVRRVCEVRVVCLRVDYNALGDVQYTVEQQAGSSFSAALSRAQR